MIYKCITCGKDHDGLPDLGIDKPDQWWDVAEEERYNRIELTPDTCIIDNEHYFIRGVLQIPIFNFEEDFGFGVWVSQKKENFFTYVENYDSNEIGPFFGWLSTQLRYFEQDTINLKTMAHFRGKGLRPLINVEPTTHPLSIAQHKGITMDEALKIVHFYMDSHEGA